MIFTVQKKNHITIAHVTSFIKKKVYVSTIVLMNVFEMNDSKQLTA